MPKTFSGSNGSQRRLNSYGFIPFVEDITCSVCRDLNNNSSRWRLFRKGWWSNPCRGVIKGYVTELDTTTGWRTEADLLASGPGVEGASVSLIGTSKVATTNYLGEFTLSNVAPGRMIS